LKRPRQTRRRSLEKRQKETQSDTAGSEPEASKPTTITMGDRQAALVTFMGTFMTVHETVNDLSELADGVIIFEALSEMYVRIWVDCCSS
jgi:hypothetical protein